jgi:hypothetical protein
MVKSKDAQAEQVDQELLSAVVVNTLQNVLITFEMLVFSILHAFSFPSLEYRDSDAPRASVGRRIMNMLDVSDVYADVTTSFVEAEQGIADTARTVARGTMRAAGELPSGAIFCGLMSGSDTPSAGSARLCRRRGQRHRGWGQS